MPRAEGGRYREGQRRLGTDGHGRLQNRTLSTWITFRAYIQVQRTRVDSCCQLGAAFPSCPAVEGAFVTLLVAVEPLGVHPTLPSQPCAESECRRRPAGPLSARAHSAASNRIRCARCRSGRVIAAFRTPVWLPPPPRRRCLPLAAAMSCALCAGSPNRLNLAAMYLQV